LAGNSKIYPGMCNCLAIDMMEHRLENVLLVERAIQIGRCSQEKEVSEHGHMEAIYEQSYTTPT